MSPPTDKKAPKAQSKNKPKSNKSQNQKQTQSKGNKNRGHYIADGNQNHKKPTIILPHLHKDILTSLNGAISPEPVYTRPDSKDHKVVAETYPTNIVAFFTCTNTPCAKGASWSSGKVAIVIRRFNLPTTGGLGYNATVYNQRCKSCNELGAMNIDKEVYVERVAYRLKVWAGVPVERRPFNGNKETPPHRKDLCEGCKRGVCTAYGMRKARGSRRGIL
ncbi:Zinc-binding domain containing protein [Rhypophila decipiens]